MLVLELSREGLYVAGYSRAIARRPSFLYRPRLMWTTWMTVSELLPVPDRVPVDGLLDRAPCAVRSKYRLQLRSLGAKLFSQFEDADVYLYREDWVV
jgi:hypothetical protein